MGFVAAIDNKIIGYVDIIFFQDIAHGGFLGQIQNLIVAKEYRGQGIGKRLAKKAIDFAKEMGFKELHVWTKFDNVKAISLYEKMGFKRSSLLLEIEF
ncbi:MAG: GNAT family N-acetyltransferase [Candidatus Asgardarchaeum sp.]